jgi:hypothetical protein
VAPASAPCRAALPWFAAAEAVDGASVAAGGFEGQPEQGDGAAPAVRER